MSRNRRYQELAKKWINDEISPEEKTEFIDWYNRQQCDPILIPQDIALDEEHHRQIILDRINQRRIF